MNKHGIENFILTVLEIVPDIDQLKTREDFWLERLQSGKPEIGYNIKMARLYEQEPEKCREKVKYPSQYISDQKTQKTKLMPEQKKKISEGLRRKWAERKAAGIPFTAGMTGKKHKPESKAKISKTNKEIVEKAKERIRASLRDKKWKDDTNTLK
jgi:group I intron endonuclease